MSGQSTEELEQNYVPMSANSPSHHHSGSLSEPVHEANYVPMTPSTMEFSSLGKQVPPPAHMGFRSSPKTPPRRPILSDCQPPPVDRNLKPDRKGEWRTGAHARAGAFNSPRKPPVCARFINRTSSNDPAAAQRAHSSLQTAVISGFYVGVCFRCASLFHFQSAHTRLSS